MELLAEIFVGIVFGAIIFGSVGAAMWGAMNRGSSSQDFNGKYESRLKWDEFKRGGTP